MGWHIHFGRCYDGAVYGCDGQSMVIGQWDNSNCDGVPKEQVNNMQMSCYGKPFGPQECGNSDNNNRKWYKYECYGGNFHAAEEEIGDVAAEMDPNINIGIVMAILLFVCFIGVIVGYLIHRKNKKKSAEKNSLLCEATTAPNF